MSRTHFSRTFRFAALAYPPAMAAGGLLTGALETPRWGSALSCLAEPGLTFLFVFVALPVAAFAGDPFGGEAPLRYGPVPWLGVGAAVNVLLAAAVTCCARTVAAELPCRWRGAPAP